MVIAQVLATAGDALSVERLRLVDGPLFGLQWRVHSLENEQVRVRGTPHSASGFDRRSEQLIGFVRAPQEVIDLGEVADRVEGIRVVAAPFALNELGNFGERRDRVFDAGLFDVERGQVDHHRGPGFVVLIHVLENLVEGLLGERAPARLAVHQGQARPDTDCVRVGRSQALLKDLVGLLEERLRLVVEPLLTVEVGQVGHRDRVLLVFVELCRVEPDGLLEQRRGLIEQAQIPVQIPHRTQNARPHPRFVREVRRDRRHTAVQDLFDGQRLSARELRTLFAEHSSEEREHALGRFRFARRALRLGSRELGLPLDLDRVLVRTVALAPHGLFARLGLHVHPRAHEEADGQRTDR